MDGTELGRRIARLRAEAKARRRLATLWRMHPAMPAAASAADCLRSAKEPTRRLEPLRHRPGSEPTRGGRASRRGAVALGSDPLGLAVRDWTPARRSLPGTARRQAGSAPGGPRTEGRGRTGSRTAAASRRRTPPRRPHFSLPRRIFPAMVHRGGGGWPARRRRPMMRAVGPRPCAAPTASSISSAWEGAAA